MLAASLYDTLLLTDWNVRVVVLGTALLGVAGGVVGSFLVLRKRALLGDAVSHAMLPGVVGAFIAMQLLGYEGKSLAGLLTGAALAGWLASWSIPLLKRVTGLKEDAVMGVVLGGGFGLGIALLGVAQSLPEGNQAGLESFIYGRAASMLASDAIGIGVTAVVAVAACTLLAKEFRLLCFDEAFGRAIGRREGLLDLMLMLLAVTVTVVGLQAVGLILVIALLIIPAAAARFWTDDCVCMVALAGAIGATSCWLGTSISAAAPKLPAGSIVVLTLTGLFIISLAFGVRRGGLWRLVNARRLSVRTARQHLLRAAAEQAEVLGGAVWTLQDLHGARSWSHSGAQRSLRRGIRAGDVAVCGEGFRLTSQGAAAARRILRNHRLWELFLIRYADIAASHVDRGADLVEHVLDDAIVRELELAMERGDEAPPSPHPIGDVS